MLPKRFPASRVFLGRRLLECAFAQDGRALFVAIQDGASTSIARLRIDSGLLETLTDTPEPSAGVLYGGGLFDVRGDTLVYAARGGRIQCLDLVTGDLSPATVAFPGVGAPVLSPCGRFVAFVAEEGSSAAVFVASLDGMELHRMPGSLPFCCDPAFGPGGAYLAYQTWPGDQMPWNHSELRIVSFHTPLSECEAMHQAFPLTSTAVVRGDTQLAFPLPHPDGTTLLFVSDETGIRTPWALDLASGTSRPLGTFQGEVGSPNWVQRMMPMALVHAGTSLLAVARHEGVASLMLVDVPTGKGTTLDSACTSISTVCAAAGDDGADLLAYVGSSPTSPSALMVRELRASIASPEVQRVSSSVGLWSSDRLASASIVRWTTVGGVEVSGVLTRMPDAAPGPLVVMVHGGPTSASELGYDALAQFLATRGYASLSVNYRGSTQRGRAFQELLRGAWGQVDVEDARTGALAMVAQGLADPERLAIMGGSAGGYTALMSLAAAPELWTAGIALYGLGDLYDAAAGTHRFEQPYQGWLVGQLPDAGPLWRRRSPIHHAASVRAPVLLFHGKDDKAVPCQQSIDFAHAIARQGGIAQLVTYDGEGHGFRMPANRRDMLERIEAFLDKYVLNKQASA